MNTSSVAIIGSGFAGLSAASILAKAGYDVTVYEKNDQAGGRARVWSKDGFRFDMGPSWYWMPDVFENFFHLFGKKSSDFYELKRLDPSYRVYWGANDFTDVPAHMSKLKQLFEELEPGASEGLDNFLKQAEYKYQTGMGDFVFRPSHSITEYIDLKLISASFRLQLFTSLRNHARSYFKHPKIIEILEFPVLFLGGTAATTPALYSLMNYADLALGTWYPMGGMNEIVKAMVSIAHEQGVKFRLNTEVRKIRVSNGIASGLETDSGFIPADLIISNADYHHTDQVLLESQYRGYSSAYWNTRTLSPSSLLFYIGINKKLKDIPHHSLFFDEDFNKHSDEIYNRPQWPEKPLFYVCCASKTDPSVAPEGGENLFFLIPVAPGLEDTEEIRERYFKLLVDRFETVTGETIKDAVVVKRSYAIKDFVEDYHSFKGNAYGLANTLLQTAFLKPKLRSRKVKNLFYAGQLTIPGPGVPPAIISGQVAAEEAMKVLRL
ncbi:phytoene desaturase [Arcticibacter pallidicorallinus]|uniref:Phytoene desaturase n=1 Tax=Arcticibacter pallidicorallinus TaxID=1259464 RepID=A0A2T0U9L6_9SPHI|nr:phytoene desaturase family protein [Arcticibacter pallidicorallinus]PRY54558.1 phytoene desaturase [Arcticibacter pallidicorallinus]